MDDLVTCPYNVAHTIKKTRMQGHLLKCRKNYPGEFVVCTYNATHHIRKEELLFHLETCVDKFAVQARQLASMQLSSDGGFLTRPKSNLPPPQELQLQDEDWLDDIAGGPIQSTYNPKQATEKKQILRAAPVAPPAQRKEFRKAEDARLKELKSRGPAVPSIIPGLPRKDEDSDDEDKKSTVSSLASFNVGGTKLRAFCERQHRRN